MPTPEQVRERVEAYARTFSNDDREGWLACFTPDAVLCDPVTAPPHVGLEGIASFWDNVHGLADDVSFDIHHIHVCGEEAAMVFTITTKSAGGGVQIEAVDIFRIDDEGLIREQRAYWDPSAMKPLPPPA